MPYCGSKWIRQKVGGTQRVARRQGPYRGRTQVPACPGVGREVVEDEIPQGSVEVLTCKEGWVSPSATASAPPLDVQPGTHLQRQPAALAETGRPQPRPHGQRRQGPQHSGCATSQPPGSPTSAGHRLAPKSLAHRGTAPGAAGQSTGQSEPKGVEGGGEPRQRGTQGLELVQRLECRQHTEAQVPSLRVP